LVCCVGSGTAFSCPLEYAGDVKLRAAAIYDRREFAAVGGLMSYGTRFVDVFPKADGRGHDALSMGCRNRVSTRYFRGTLRGAPAKCFHAVENNLRQLHYLLTQFSVFRNIALNTVAIGL
jgi:hypothetical protein